MTTPMLNRDVFATPPEQLELLNNGVAEVKGGRTDAELRTLRYELATFVCEGQYESGLRRLLESYLSNLNKTEQQGVWVSGFYGSGKSHFLKVLRAIWTDEPFDDGTRPRGLARLSPEITDLLRELSTRAAPVGGLHAASGTLGAAATSVRLGILAIVFRSVDLPEQYDLASFVLWLRANGCLAEVRAAVEAAGRSWDQEVADFLVSPVMHQAIASHFPGWTTPVSDISQALLDRFRHREEVSNDEMVTAIRAALTRNGQFPRTLIAIDEVQQFIDESAERALAVQEAIEECCKRFGASLLVVGTGQAAMGGSTQLRKIRARFPIEVQLSDTDVDTVVRQLVLRKRPDKTAVLRSMFEKYSGEVSKHLAGTRIGPRPEDDGDILVADYPLLPVRRRFWEQCLQATDDGGKTAQLRNQIVVVYEAVRSSADAALGAVIPADFLYFQLQGQLVQTEALPRNVYELALRLHASSDEMARLQARLVALVFLIGKLPHNESPTADLGVRANADTLADLLVDRLDHGSAELRRKVPVALQALVDAGHLMYVADEFRVQTPESTAWEADFQKHRKALSDDGQKIVNARSEAISAAVNDKSGLFKLPFGSAGTSKASRTVRLHVGPNTPSPGACSRHRGCLGARHLGRE